MKSTKKAFSLIEVIVAASILSIAVFGIYKLIWENTKIISNNDNYYISKTMFTNLEECINFIWFDSFKNSSETSYSFNFWNDLKWCYTWTSNQVLINNIDYKLSWEIVWTWDDYINWKLSIFADWVWENIKDFRQIK